jgi:hypothetical protein
MKVLLAVDEDAASEEAVNQVRVRRWEEGTTVRVLHVVGDFVPPAQELWFDAGGDPDRAREEIRERSTDLTRRVGGWLREQGLAVETAVRDGEPARPSWKRRRSGARTSLSSARSATGDSGGCSRGASRATL